MGATSSLWNSQDHHSQSTSRGRDHHQQQQQQQHLQPSYHGECISQLLFKQRNPKGQSELWTSLSYFTHSLTHTHTDKETASQFEGHFKLFSTLRAVFLLALMTQQTINIWPFILCLWQIITTLARLKGFGPGPSTLVRYRYFGSAYEKYFAKAYGMLTPSVCPSVPLFLSDCQWKYDFVACNCLCPEAKISSSLWGAKTCSARAADSAQLSGVMCC